MNTQYPVTGMFGLATLVNGTIDIANDAITSNSMIFLTAQEGVHGVTHVSSKEISVGFTITSSDPTDNSTVGYLIIEGGI